MEHRRTPRARDLNNDHRKIMNTVGGGGEYTDGL